jgi:TPR repeat protein
MLASIISLALALLFLQTPANSLPPRGDVRLQDSPDQHLAQDSAQLQAQAEGGNPKAQLKLARAYEFGVGVPQDDALAALWYRKAAEQGNSEAQDTLGAKFLIGQGVQRDKEEAVKWFRESARQKNASAMYHLGAAYYNGDGVPIDDGLSYAWFTLANEAGNQSAVEALQRAESELKAMTVTNGFKRIAEMYEAGGSLPENQPEAARWWSKAAARGDQDSQVALANKFINGQGVPQDLTQGRILCTEAAKQENHGGQYCMGYIYQRGLGVTPDAKKARDWYGRAAALGDPQSMNALALMEATGEGGKVDRVDAFLLYAKLLRTGHKEALQNMAKLKKEISQKEWELLQKPLLHLRIDPSKLDLALQQIDTH